MKDSSLTPVDPSLSLESPGLFWSIFQNRNFSFLFLGQLVSQVGDSMYQIGLLWFVLDLTGSNSTMGLVAMISYLPMLFFGLPAGILVDMLDRRKLMLVSDFMRTLIVAALPVCYFLGWRDLTLVVGLSFSIAAFSTLFNPARDSVIPDLVSPANLIKANSLIQVSHYSAILLGPALAGIIIALVGVVHLFTLDAVTFLLSFFAILFIKNLSEQSDRISGMTAIRGHFFDILRYIHRDKRVRFLLGLTAVNNFFIMGPAIVGIPIFVKEVLHQGAVGYALVESSLGLGMLVGAVVVNFSVRYLSKAKVLLLALMFDGLTLGLVFLCEHLEILMVLIAFHAIGIPHIVVTRTSLMQEWVAKKRLGRVFSLVNMAVIGTTALTTAVTGFLAEFIPISHIFGLFGIIAMLSGIAGWSYSILRNS